ncbi:MAG: tyrosine-protein phosphatase [Actinobacteria bacterium]|nr:tyrosine-protein phosphatase [Actinomycetota bacterium]
MPWIDLEGAANARDLGGLPTEDGGKTVAGRLLRSDNLQELTPADISKLTSEYGLSTVVDLRSTAELNSEGPAPMDGRASVEHRHHPVLPEEGLATDAVADVLVTSRSERDRSRYPDNAVTGHYLGYLEDRPDQVVAALRSVARAPGAALVHCAAGKDRTGVVVALALSVAGVRPDAIVADYAATGDRTEPLLARLRRSPTYSADINRRPADSHKPQAATMAAFLTELDARFGGAAAWLTAHGLSDDDLELLRAKLRAPGRADLQ